MDDPLMMFAMGMLLGERKAQQSFSKKEIESLYANGIFHEEGKKYCFVKTDDKKEVAVFINPNANTDVKLLSVADCKEKGLI